ncbi:NAD(P)-binding protein [Infundibulicybe gibba]|nr:NAD(P)-binding protein [Infundibulicybe gibba]
MTLVAIGVGFVVLSLLLVAYVIHNDRKLVAIPPKVSSIKSKKWTPSEIRTEASKLFDSPVSTQDYLPPKTGRRYIVVGGSGFLGGWIISQLLKRGEEPESIRIVDMHPPTRPDLCPGAATRIKFVKVDMTDILATREAFALPWPGDQAGRETPRPPITVFHTAASMRFFERHAALVAQSEIVNRCGTQNIVNAARSVGADVLIYTSSISVHDRPTRLLLWPWERRPQHFVQVINEKTQLGTSHVDFFSNYAYTKFLADTFVRAADGSSSSGGTLRTGCIRPGNAIFGAYDSVFDPCLARQSAQNPTWLRHAVQSFMYVENCALAHLAYEQRLIALSAGGDAPDIGGKAFVVTDPGPPPTFDDLYTAIGTLTAGRCQFQSVSPTALLLLAHVLETYHVFRARFCQSLPPLSPDLMKLQPSTFQTTLPHFIIDDSLARASPAEGGLGYQSPFTTQAGCVKMMDMIRKRD